MNPLRPRVNALSCLLPCLLLLWLLPGCSEEPMVRVDLSEVEQTVMVRDRNVVTYAYLPQYSHTISYLRHRLLVEYLRQETGLPLKQIFPDTFDEHLQMVQRGDIDISFTNPFMYIKIAEAGGQAFARIVELSGQPDFWSQIIVHADNKEIETLDDCRGKRWIAVDRTSAGGYLFALGHFVEHGILPEDFAEIAFAPGPGGKQEKVVLSVYAGAYDVGSVRDGTLALMEGKLDLSKIRVLAESRRYPGWLFSARKGLDPAIVDKVARAMFKLDNANPEHTLILDTARFLAIIPSQDSDYDPVRELVARVGLE